MTDSYSIDPTVTPVAFRKKTTLRPETKKDAKIAPNETMNLDSRKLLEPFSRKGASEVAYKTAASLGYELTDIGRQDFERKPDPKE